MLKKSVVIRAKRLKPLNLDYKTVVFFTLMICGIILGISLVKNSDGEFNKALTNLIESINSTKYNNSLLSCVFYVFGWLFLLVLLTFFGGLSGVGLPFISLVNIVFGIICGVFCGIYYVKYGIQGIGFFSLVYLPCYAITAATLIKCCCESFKMSLGIFSFLSGINVNQNKNKKILNDYILNYLILSIPIIIASILNVAGFKVFVGLFDGIII